MTRGVYIAATGLLSQARSLDVIGNNLANLETAGYKKDVLTKKSFGDHLTYRLSPEGGAAQIGSSSSGVIADGTITQYSQGETERTNRNLDLAIQGEGFFTVILQDGTPALTRDGQFTLDQDGYLTDFAGNRVQGTNGLIQLNNPDFTVDQSGNIYSGNTLAGTLMITCPADPTSVKKQGEGLYSFSGASVGFTGRIEQGALEASNVDMTSEMAGMIAGTRSFQTCAQIVRTMDEMMSKAVQLGSLK